MKSNHSFSYAITSLLVSVFFFAFTISCVKEIQSIPPQSENVAKTSVSDTIKPTVKFTFPDKEDTLIDSITIKIKATDNVAVASVECKIDGVSLGIKTAAPYNFGWNTKTVMNGAHELLAKAMDAAGNSATKKITVHTKNPGALSMEQELFNMINALRSSRSLPVLIFNSKIHTAARNHALDMAYNNFYSHVGSSGSTLGDRLTAAGYPWTIASENISAAVYYTATDVYNAWNSNSGQRSIMLEPTMRDGAVGVGYNFKSTYKHYWVFNAASTQ